MNRSSTRSVDFMINEIVEKIDKLSNNLIKVVYDFQEKFNFIEGKILYLAKDIYTKVGDNEGYLNQIHELTENLKTEQDKFMAQTITDVNEAVAKMIKNFQGNINELQEKQKENEKIIDKVNKIDNILRNNKIQIENINNNDKKEYKDIKINKFASNSNNKELKYKIFQKNNVIYLNDITKDCEEKSKELELVDKVKIIFKKDENEENVITLEKSSICKE